MIGIKRQTQCIPSHATRPFTPLPLARVPRARAVVIVSFPVHGLAQAATLALQQRVHHDFLCVLMSLHELFECEASTTGSCRR